MRWLITPLLLVLVLMTLGGCGTSSYLEIPQGTQMTSPYLHFNAPSAYEGIPWRAWSIHSQDDTVQLYRHLPNRMSEDVNLYLLYLPQKGPNYYRLLSKESNVKFESWWENLPLSKEEIRIYREMGITFHKRYVVFIAGLKCSVLVKSNSLVLGLGNRIYSINCDYYDRQGQQKTLYIQSYLTYTYGGTILEGSSRSSVSSEAEFEKIRLQFHQDLKEIFDSIVIHDMDRIKMEEEGLLYEKLYEIPAY